MMERKTFRIFRNKWTDDKLVLLIILYRAHYILNEETK